MSKYESVETHSFLQAPSLQHRFKNWQTLRKHKLTASTFAAAIGFWRRQRCQLWLEKIEIKCPYLNGDMSKAFPWSRIPIRYIPQAQGLMEILGRDWMDFYVWTPNGSSLFRLHRDAEYWNVMEMALSDFWWKHVHPARELYSRKVITDPLFELRSFRPARRHELCSHIISESIRIANSSKLLMREIRGILQPDDSHG
ncbi:hypothetical protein Ahy_B04g070389 isoform B [Arachis hypogaea]|uniref:Uncharacterized protein n=1 Tax=Arachis hypogaea TaxID=3818 RepID=A0A444ZGK3_ARAHY|nr:hypothetical protein Ahy_B04g070389 isoform B [Arachis hypogaea]